MTKLEFLSGLVKRLEGREERSNIVQYYREMIDDRIDDGMTEEEAVAAMGSIDDICREYFPESLKKEDAECSNVGTASGGDGNALVKTLLMIVYIIFAVTVWTVIISLWIAVVSICVCAVSLILASVPVFFKNVGSGFVILGSGQILLGVFVVANQGIELLTELTKKLFKSLKSKIG